MKKLFLLIIAFIGYGSVMMAQKKTYTYYGEKASSKANNPCKGATIRICGEVTITPIKGDGGERPIFPTFPEITTTNLNSTTLDGDYHYYDLPENVEGKTKVYAKKVLVLPPDITNEDYRNMKKLETTEPGLVVVKAIQPLD